VNGDAAINIASAPGSNKGWANGVRFVGGPGLAGNIGINFETEYAMGLDLGPNSMRMNAGEKIFLEHFGTAWLSYNPETSNIDLYKANTLVASW
jgi:hypothetical protein